MAIENDAKEKASIMHDKSKFLKTNIPSMDGCKPTSDYQDYIFKDGKLLGKFDEMYRASSAVPWHQDKASQQIPVAIDLALISHFAAKFRSKRVCDLGCGLGFVTEKLRSTLHEVCLDARVFGCDISPKAVEDATKQFPNITFFQGDIRSKDFLIPETNFDFIYVKDILWYVLDDIDQVVVNIKRMLSKTEEGGVVYIMQSFPDKKGFIGSDVFPDPQSLVEFFKLNFKPLYHNCNEEFLPNQVNRVNVIDRYARFLGQ